MSAKLTQTLRAVRRNGSPWPALLPVILLLALLTGAGQQLLAHGGGIPRIINQPAGPYTLSVWTDPDPLVTNDTHVEVAVLEPSSLEPIVRGVRVMVELRTDARPGEPFIREATTAQSAIKTLYVAVYDDLPTDGRWQVTVRVDGEAGSADPVSFPIDIEPPAGPNWLRYGLMAAAVVAAAAVVVIWSRRQPKRDARPRGRPPGNRPRPTPDTQ